MRVRLKIQLVIYLLEIISPFLHMDKQDQERHILCKGYLIFQYTNYLNVEIKITKVTTFS